MIPDILKKVRLFYSDINEDFWSVHLNDLCNLNYSGLEDGGVVVVASNLKAQNDEEHVFDLSKIPENISRVMKNNFELGKLGQSIDSPNEFPFEKFKYMNISAFKEGTVIKLDSAFSEEKIKFCVNKLKELYGQLIS